MLSAMNKHNFGSWIADNNEGFSIWTIWGRIENEKSGIFGPPIMIAKVIGDSADTDARAKLIAASPDLLNVAEIVLQTATIETPKELLAAAFAAIKKATE